MGGNPLVLAGEGAVSGLARGTGGVKKCRRAPWGPSPGCCRTPWVCGGDGSYLVTEITLLPVLPAASVAVTCSEWVPEATYWVFQV